MKYDSRHVIECQRRKKAQAVEYLGGQCSICGYKRCLACLQFHHVDPTIKEHAPSYIVGRWSFDRAKKELDKCILVCSNCHGEIHYGMYMLKDLQKRKLPVLTKKCQICLETYETKNENQKYCSNKCNSISQRRAERPSKEELDEMLWLMPTTKIAKKYNVSDKAVEKWAKRYKIDKPPRGYWAKKYRT